jgi:hypothetical protein
MRAFTVAMPKDLPKQPLVKPEVTMISMDYVNNCTALDAPYP